MTLAGYKPGDSIQKKCSRAMVEAYTALTHSHVLAAAYGMASWDKGTQRALQSLAPEVGRLLRLYPIHVDLCATAHSLSCLGLQ